MMSILEDDFPLFIEKRKYPRLYCFLLVEFTFNDHTYRDSIINISEGGIFIETKVPLPVGYPLTMYFKTHDISHSIVLSGIVVRRDQEGVGVQFIKRNYQDIKSIQYLIENCNSMAMI